MMLHILTTGGTIEGLDYNEKDRGREKSNFSIKAFLEAANVSFQYNIEEVFTLDSRFISQEHRESLANKIRAVDSDKILITHGTYTMEDTAKYIGNLKFNKTIVLTGSFILGTSAKTDAPFNLGFAISSLQFLKPDVYVAMNGEVFHWGNVTKNLETNKFEYKNE
ncbi:asparaginase domain-containing protein [Flavobacteriaceae bacterium F89]|uniref:Asparaginase domain-containing protein n=1 Tax=Cerina litoralis TaxID=2874477 RepID=A0AAE3JRA8_9FLAO|nr:asparaginase domain-containing protein [Cerina litoralis]MCG2459452.1 asparaginase domain-containing protein [Cerina litoralis]